MCCFLSCCRARGENCQNRKVTDYYPIRRSSRKSNTELKVRRSLAEILLRLIKGDDDPSPFRSHLSFGYQCEEKKQIDDLITNGIEEGMEVCFCLGCCCCSCWRVITSRFHHGSRFTSTTLGIGSSADASHAHRVRFGLQVQHVEGKGRAVFATRCFQKGEYVVEYHGDLLQFTDAKKREAEYAQNPATGCYMYYFQHLCKKYWCVA